MKACITVKLPNGDYKNINAEDIEQVFINTNGEKAVFWKDGYGYEVDNHTLSANTFVNNKLSANWVEWSPASEEEIEMYNKGIHHYRIGDKKWIKK